MESGSVDNDRTKPGDQDGLERLTKKVAKGGFTFLTFVTSGKALDAVLHIVLLRVLGATSYGLYALGFSVVRVASAFSMLGLQNGMVRFISLYKGIGDSRRAKGTLISGFTGAIIFSAIVSSLLFAFSGSISTKFFHDPSFLRVLKGLCISVPFYVLMMMVSFSARGFQMPHCDSGIRNALFPVLNLILVSIVFLLGLRLFGAIYAFSAALFLSALPGFYLIKRAEPEVFSHQLRPVYEFRKLVRFSAPVLLIGMSYVLLSQVDRIMIGHYMDSSDVGIYNAVLKISALAGLFSGSIVAIFAPIISDLYNRNKLEQLESLYKTSTRWILSLSLPVILIVVIFPKNILNLLYGADSAASWGVLVALCLPKLIFAGGGPTAAILQMTGKQDIELVNTIATVLINIYLNIWLIQSYGILGAALATGISITVIVIARLIEVYKFASMHPYDRKYSKPVLSGIFATVICLIFRHFLNRFWLVNLALLITTYFACLYLLGMANEDRLVIKEGIRRLGFQRRQKSI